MSGPRSSLYTLLRWSEKYTKTDMVYLARGGFWSVLAQIVTALLVFTFAVIVAYVLPKEVYGDYKYILALVALLGTFSLSGLGAAVFQSVARGYDGALQQGFWLNLKWSALAIIGAFALSAYYFLLGNTTLALGVLVGGSLAPLLTSASLSGVFLNAKKDFARSSIYFSIIENLLAIGALILTILLTKNPLIIAIVYFLGNTLATYWLYRRVIRIYRPDPSKTDPGMLTYAKHLSLMGILSSIAGNIDQVLVFHFVGPVQLALYNFAIAIPDQTKGPLKMFNAMLLPKLVNRSDIEVEKGMRNKMLWLLLSSVLFVLLYGAAAPFIYAFFFPAYRDAAGYSQIYAISTLSIFFSPAGTYLVAKKKVREQYVSTTVLSLLQIGAMLVGVALWGLLGLIVAQIVIKIGGGLFTYLLYRHAARAS